MLPRLLISTKIQTAIAVAVLVATAASAAKVTSVFYENAALELERDRLAAKSEAAATARELELTQLELTGAILLANTATHKKLRILTREITTEVIKYVQDTSITRCDMPPQFVRIHDSAARAGMSLDTGAATGTDGATRRVTDSDVLATVTTNYDLCSQWRIDLISLQEYARSLQALNGKEKK